MSSSDFCRPTDKVCGRVSDDLSVSAAVPEPVSRALPLNSALVTVGPTLVMLSLLLLITSLTHAELPAKPEFVILSSLPEFVTALDRCCSMAAESLLTLVFLAVSVGPLGRESEDDTANCDVAGREVFVLLLCLVLVSVVKGLEGPFDVWEEFANVTTLLASSSADCCCVSTAAWSLSCLFPPSALSSVLLLLPVVPGTRLLLPDIPGVTHLVPELSESSLDLGSLE